MVRNQYISTPTIKKIWSVPAISHIPTSSHGSCYPTLQFQTPTSTKITTTKAMTTVKIDKYYIECLLYVSHSRFFF